MADKTLTIGPFAGLNNRTERTRLKQPTKTDPRYELFDATNVDITDAGSIKSRPGYDLLRAGVCTALWGDDAVCYAVLDGTLYEVDGSLGLAEVSSVGDGPCCFWREHGVTYFGSQNITGQIVDGALSALGIARPGNPPSIAVASGGGLYAGQYGVAYSTLGDDGNESGMSEPAWITLTTTGRIAVTGLPDTGLRTNIYATATNGETFYRVATLAASDTAHTLTAIRSALPAQNMGIYPAPVGAHALCLYRGVLYLAIGDLVFPSEPLTYGWWRPDKYLKPPSKALHILPVTDGIFFACTDQLVFMAGTAPGDFSQLFVQKCAPIAGTQADLRGHQVGANGAAKWSIATDRGLLYLYDGGQITNQTEMLDIPASVQGGAALRDYGGEQHLTTSFQPKSGFGFRENWTVNITYNGLPVKE